MDLRRAHYASPACEKDFSFLLFFSSHGFNKSGWFILIDEAMILVFVDLRLSLPVYMARRPPD